MPGSSARNRSTSASVRVRGAARPARCRGSARPSPPARGSGAASTRCTTSPTRPRNRAGPARAAAPRRRRTGRRTSPGAAAARPGRRPPPRRARSRRPSRGSGRPARDSRTASAAASRRDRAQRRRGRHDRRQVGAAVGRPSAGSGTQRVPLRTTSTPTPGGPPHLCALAVRSDQPPGTGTRPTDCAASTSSGTPARGAGLGRRPTGCTVPTSWLALISAASATPGAATAAAPGVQVDPAEPVHADRDARCRRPRRAARPRAAPRSARSRSARTSLPDASRPPSPPSDGGVHRGRAAGGEGELVRAYPEHLGGRGRGPRRAAGGPGGPAE